jgi:LPXTG-site transpeptidase (sortase) family protein
VTKYTSKWLTLRRFNNGLSLLIVILAFYIFFLPVVPQLAWWIKHSAPLISTPVKTSLPSPRTPIPQDNRLLIPAIDIDQPILEGQSVYTVDKGIWMRPNASTPDKGSNTVLAGHRLSYTQPRGVFYFLDKIKVGDPIEVYWHGKAYTYVTRAIIETVPQDGTVEQHTTASILTLYTCTPLWNFKHRLVVIASEVSHT